ncbi:hypothetical protein ES705_36303 [subsurface metagenome]
MKSRIDKFAKKISGDNRKKLYDAQKDQMVKLETIASRDMAKIEIQVKSIINGVPTFYEHFYMAFAKEIYSKQKKFKGQTLLNELTILDNKWEMRGLDENLLKKIKNFYVPAYPVIVALHCFEASCFTENCFT